MPATVVQMQLDPVDMVHLIIQLPIVIPMAMQIATVLNLQLEETAVQENKVELVDHGVVVVVISN